MTTIKKSIFETIVNEISDMSNEDRKKVLSFIRDIKGEKSSTDEKVESKKEVEKKTSEKKASEKKSTWKDHVAIDGLKIVVIYKDSSEDGSFQWNRVSKGIKFAIKNHGAKWTGDYDKQIFMWTFKSKKDLESFIKEQENR